MDINELKWLEDIDFISKEYESTFGAPPLNLSDWNPSLKFKEDLNIRTPLSEFIDPIDYIFSYDLGCKEKIINRIGFSNSGFLATHSGSSAILASISAIKSRGYKKALIVCPHYFTVPYALKSMGLEYSFIYSSKQGSKYLLPTLDEINEKEFDFLWITNPVYCTGIKYNSQDLRDLIYGTQKDKIIVIDECINPDLYINCIYKEIKTENTFIIFSPHKSICVNGIKFGGVSFPHSYQNEFDDWSDVLQGCLPKSSLVAIDHFLSSDFSRYRSEFIEKIYNNYTVIKEIISDFRSLDIDDFCESYLVTVYANHIPAKHGENFKFMKEVAYHTGATFISGRRNKIPDSVGLSFRINLACHNKEFEGCIFRTFQYLNNLKPII